jgi:hypothetical protein
MPPHTLRRIVKARKEVPMASLMTVIVLAFVVLVAAVALFGLYELTPLARKGNEFRDPRTGARRWNSPHLN